MTAGDCACACCCASTTVFDNPRVGGLHPEKVLRETFTVSAREPGDGEDMGGFRHQLLRVSVHIVGLSVFADPGNASGSSDLKGVSCMFYTATEPDNTATYKYLATVALKPGESYTFGDEITGHFADLGLYVAAFGNSGLHGSNSVDDRIAINLTYTERREYTPAFQDPLEHVQHYWGCNRGDELYHNWYGGGEADSWTDSSSGYVPDPDIELSMIDPPSGGGIGTDWPLNSQSGDYILSQNGDPLLTNSMGGNLV